MHVHESVTADGTVGQLRGELQHYAYRDIADHLETIDRYTTLAARQMHEDGRRAGLRTRGPSAAGVPAQLRRCAAASATAAGLDHLGDERPLRVPEVREAVGIAAKPDVRSRQALTPDVLPPHRHGPDLARRTEPGPADRHRAARVGHRAVLVAHPDGELRRRAAEGLDLIPLAPRTEIDLDGGWKLSRVIKRLQPGRSSTRTIRTASRWRRWRCRCRRAAESVPPLVASRRVDFHLKSNSFSRWKYRQVDCFIAASDAIRQMLVADGVPAERIVTVHEGIDVEHVRAAPPVNVHAAFWLPHGAPVVGNVGALVAAQGPAAPGRGGGMVCARCPTRAS